MQHDTGLFPHQPISLRMVCLLFLISASSIVFSFALHAAVSRFAPAPEEVQRSAAQRTVKQLTLQYTVGTMAFWVMEELIFRGFLLQKLRQRVSLRTAMWVSSGLFAVEHLFGGVYMFFLALGMGYYFAWLLVKTNSLYAPIVAHWAFDFSALYIFLPLRGITAIAAEGRIPDASQALFPWYAYPLAAITIVICAKLFREELNRNPANSNDYSMNDQVAATGSSLPVSTICKKSEHGAMRCAHSR